MKSILITGPESSGKTTLASHLAEKFALPVLEEHARNYLEEKGAEYNQSTLLNIAQEHSNNFEAADKTKLLIMDTYLINIKIWSLEKYSECDPWVLNKLKTFKPALVLLCQPDIPWEADPLRENPKDRDRLFARFKEEVEYYELDYWIVNKDNRGKILEERLSDFLSKV